MKLVASAAAWLFAVSLAAHAVEDASDAYIIDLPTTLRLAGARNIDIQLAHEKLAEAAGHACDAQLENSIVSAAQAYFDLVATHSAAGVAREALCISSDYQTQIDKAVSIGLAFKGDALRVKVQRQRDEIALQQAEEKLLLAAARLAQILHLVPVLALRPHESQLLPLSLISAMMPAGTLVEQA